MIESAVGKQPPLLRGGDLVPRVMLGKGPLDAAALVEHPVVRDAGDVAGLAPRQLFENLEHRLGATPRREHLAAAPVMRDQLEDGEIGQRLPGRLATFLIRPMRRSELMNVPSFSPQPAAGRTRCASCGRLGGVVHVLHDQKIEPLEDLAHLPLVDPRVGRVGGDDPQALDLALQDAFDDFVVGPTVLMRGCGLTWMPSTLATLLAVLGVGEIVAAEQVGGVAEQARAHGVALAGDRVGAGAGAADVAGHQGEVDDGLRGAHRLRGSG